VDAVDVVCDRAADEEKKEERPVEGESDAFVETTDGASDLLLEEVKAKGRGGAAFVV
jgi:hypothetical protein